MSEPTPEQMQQIGEAIAGGNKIEAIKRYRTFTGSDLRTSKEFIEKLAGELHGKDPARYPAMPAGKGCLVLLVSVIVLLVLGLLAHAEDTSTYFPLSKGSYWIYRGEVKWVQKNDTTGKHEDQSKTLTWKMEVIDTASRGLVFAALLKGLPSDLSWYEEGKERGTHLIVRVGSAAYHLLYGENALKAWQKIKDTKESLHELVDSESLFLDAPLIDRKIFGDFAQSTTGRYCWVVEGESAYTDKVKGAPSLKDGRVFTMTYRTSPDFQSVAYVPGLGIVHYRYHHNGTPAECDMQLIEFHKGEKP